MTVVCGCRSGRVDPDNVRVGALDLGPLFRNGAVARGEGGSECAEVTFGLQARGPVLPSRRAGLGDLGGRGPGHCAFGLQG